MAAPAVKSETLTIEKSGIKVVRNPPESKLTDLGVRQWLNFTYKVIVEIEEAPDMILECVGAPQMTKKAAAEHAAKGALWY